MSSFQLECSVLKKSWGNLLFGENEMSREKLEKYIQNNYSAEPDYPWVKYPDYEVFRHTCNKKWFALASYGMQEKRDLHYLLLNGRRIEKR